MNSNQHNFQKLTPIKNADLTIYEDALNFVFQETDLKNIAITGPYSAGKSSVIESYLDNHPDKKFLNISLAHFESLDSDLASADTSQFGETHNINVSLEGKILNQLIHQIKADNIPQSQFKVKRKISNLKIWRTSSLVTIFSLLLLYIIGFKNWHDFVQSLSNAWLKSIFTFTLNDSSLLSAGVICILTFMFSLYGVIRIQYNRNMFKKVNIQGNEIEIFADANESYFDKYLNEVLYLFENADVEVFVFEDIDRFNNNQIFEKLREINLLINKKSGKVFRFFYLLRDDIFTSKDRTKFFDFIIPVVPVVDGSNSYDQFIAHFKKGGIFNDFDESFLQGLSLYIDDMRILKNIYNEYVVYHDRIQTTELNCNKLLAMVAYKNIFPKDFSELQINRGFVSNLFENKSLLIEDEIAKIVIDLIEKEKKVQSIEDELCNDIDELDSIYYKSGTRVIDVNGKDENQFSTRVEFIKEIKNNPDQVFYTTPNGYRRQLDFISEYDKLHQNAEYIERKQIIETKMPYIKDKLNMEINELQKRKVVLKNRKLNEIITKENINIVFSFTSRNEIGEEFSYDDVKSNPYFPLIKYLIRNGYIDETYSDYMTYFYEHSLSRTDKIFLRSITDEVGKEFSYQIKDPFLVNSRLVEVDFEKEEVLNFDLFAHLLITMHNNLSFFINHLKKYNRLDFVSQFWNTNREKSTLIKSLHYDWPLLCKELLEGSYFTDNQKQEYALDTLYYSSYDDIRGLNVEDCLTNYISNNREFLNINEPDVGLIISRLLILKVKFAQIDYSNANPLLFKAVYEEKLYHLNINMILLVLKYIYHLPESEDLKHKNLTLVLSKRQENLVEYINNNIEEYIRVILDYSDSKITDDENVALEILNNHNIDASLKIIYISFLQTKITHIYSVDDHELWPILLQYRTVVYSSDNILQYYFNSTNKLDDKLVEFINGEVSILNFDYRQIQDQFGAEEASTLFKDIVICNELSDEKYAALLRKLNRLYNKFSHTGISDNKVSILIRTNVIPMNKENLQFMRENYPRQLMIFVCTYINLYVSQVIDEENFDFAELLQLLEKNIEDSFKISLLAFTSESISVSGKQYSERIKLHILRSNFDIDDLPSLIYDYDSVSTDMSAQINSICIKNINTIIEEEYIVSFKLLIILLESAEIDEENKKELFITHIIKLTEKQVIACLEKLGMIDVITLFSGKWPKIERNNDNIRILKVFERKGWISGFDIDTHDTSYFRARGRRTR